MQLARSLPLRATQLAMEHLIPGNGHAATLSPKQTKFLFLRNARI